MSSGPRELRQRRAFARVWDALARAPATLPLDPGVREAWHRGRERYAVWLVRIEAPEALARMAAVSAALSAASPERFVPQRPESAHITVFVAGFPCATRAQDDDVPFATLEAQADRVRRRPPGPTRLALGGGNAFLSCPFLEVYDIDGGLERLRARLGGLTRELRFAPYRPHLTLGSLPEAVSTVTLRSALEPWREAPLLPLHIDALELVTFDPRVAGAPLETALRIPLSSPSRPRA